MGFRDIALCLHALRVESQQSPPLECQADAKIAVQTMNLAEYV